MTDAQRLYEVVAGTAAADADRAVSVWQAGGFGDPSPQRQHSRYDWFYRGCPHGEAQVNFLQVAGAPGAIGFLGVGVRNWTADGEPMRAGILVDFVVHPEHRSAVPALQLQRRGRERAFESLSALVGLPEPKAVGVFKRLGSSMHCQLPRYARVLRHAAYLRRRLPAWLAAPLGALVDALDGLSQRILLLRSAQEGQWGDGFDESFDELWAKCDKRARCIGVRDRQFLEWRFGQQPGHTYRVFSIRARKSQALMMYFVCERDADTLVIKDLLALGTVREQRDGLELLAASARRAGAAAVTVQVLADERLSRALRAARFIERDRRPFFAMVGEKLRHLPAAATWYITQADEDN